MATSSRDVRVLPNWLNAFVSVLPGVVCATTLILRSMTNHPSVFAMTPKDSFLVVGIGSILFGLVVSLSIVCFAQARALKILSSKS